ncbi:MAG: hypothetical protein V1790_16880 [Planctomycetota bacterium]
MKRKHHRAFILTALSVVVYGSSAETVSAQDAVRDLPADYVPGVTFTVSIALNPPDGTAVVGIEEQPPIGWVVSAISHSGVFDTQKQKVKWGPFFGSSVPPAVSYDIRPFGGGSGEQCFTGKVSFDGLVPDIGGDLCIPHSVPAVSGIGLAGLAVSLFVVGAMVLSRTKRTARPHR